MHTYYPLISLFCNNNNISLKNLHVKTLPSSFASLVKSSTILWHWSKQKLEQMDCCRSYSPRKSDERPTDILLSPHPFMHSSSSIHELNRSVTILDVCQNQHQQMEYCMGQRGFLFSLMGQAHTHAHACINPSTHTHKERKRIDS